MMIAAVVTILGVYLATEVFIDDMEDDGEPASSRAEMREAQAVLEAVTVSTGRAKSVVAMDLVHRTRPRLDRALKLPNRDWSGTWTDTAGRSTR
jgi:hypothetical protein